jgi:hypothetical protein
MGRAGWVAGLAVLLTDQIAGLAKGPIGHLCHRT